MKKIDRESHEVIATGMDWDTLVSTIIEIESEIRELKEYLSKKKMKEMHQTLEIYENEKKARVEKNRTVGLKEQLIYGQDYVTDWNHDPEDYM